LNAVLGAIIGDISGSRFEWHPIKSKRYEFLTKAGGCRPTDDSVMTVAVAEAVLDCTDGFDGIGEKTVARMQDMGRRYPDAGYGGRFRQWIFSDEPRPYGSFGNGSAMRVSPCAWAAETLEEACILARDVSAVTHDHPEGIRGAEAVSAAVFLALHGESREGIRDYVRQHYYPLEQTLDEIREEYSFDVTCQGSVPQAIIAFLESDSFEDAVRGAVSLGGDSDTQGAIAGSIAEAFYGIPEDLREQAFRFLDGDMSDTIRTFEAVYGAR